MSATKSVSACCVCEGISPYYLRQFLVVERIQNAVRPGRHAPIGASHADLQIVGAEYRQCLQIVVRDQKAQVLHIVSANLAATIGFTMQFQKCDLTPKNDGKLTDTIPPDPFRRHFGRWCRPDRSASPSVWEWNI